MKKIVTLKKTVLFLICLGMSVSAFSLSELNNLRVEVDKEESFVNTEVTFNLFLPHIQPEDVVVTVPVLPSSVSFVSSYKDFFIQKITDTSGTSIRLKFIFSQTGVFTLPPLEVQIQDVFYSVPFQTVTILDNPKEIQPKLIYSLSDEKGKKLEPSEDGVYTVRQDEAVTLLLGVQYAAEVLYTHWDLPRDALFEQTETFLSDSEQGKNLSAVTTVGQYRFTPLKSKEFFFPEIQVGVKTLGGKETEVLLPQIKLFSAEKNITESAPKVDAAFTEAFTPQPKEEKTTEISMEKALLLANLLSKETKAVWGADISQERKELEHALGIETEFFVRHIPLVYGIFSLGGLILILSIFLFFIKKRSQAFFCCVLFLVIVVFGFWYYYPLSTNRGIMVSDNVYQIPESTAVNFLPIKPYSYGVIEKEILGWYFVKVGLVEGWIPKEKVVLIESFR